MDLIGRRIPEFEILKSRQGVLRYLHLGTFSADCQHCLLGAGRARGGGGTRTGAVGWSAGEAPRGHLCTPAARSESGTPTD